jgi:hypothetical protein
MRGNMELWIMVGSDAVGDNRVYVGSDGSLSPSDTWFYESGVIHKLIVSDGPNLFR